MVVVVKRSFETNSLEKIVNFYNLLVQNCHCELVEGEKLTITFNNIYVLLYFYLISINHFW